MANKPTTLDEFKDFKQLCTGCGGITKAINIVAKDGVLVSFDMTSSCWCKDEEMMEEIP